ncbi:MAG: hypothetical protein COU81_02495 [Candidatus Portnoybacteria bacterium CG10_big_fil_rev_8_21_14_0_10_36_7]|uniref:UDP-N-acetylmuramoyl-tripeptide--D-alanyl-D-alanine ligase n=1 Tax=Candidatus Portnoybacteria bacterium CG10_big_fil_rev_8_21_14_0_10_36_7 TaxID=1974812 RepID=A0A2M8KDX7_9BACT|nr:MAG: hypothetical protein COU81_02495 [Candidatus Portnoybacteria bacterium CG10_big_fil_rev_8_21_14_0_10_36_7]
MLSKLLQLLLKNFAKLILARYRLIVVGITGNIGKTSAKEAIYHVLSKKFVCRKSEKSYNNPIGVPLTIIGCESPGRSILGWVRVIFKAISLVVIFNHDYPKILIMEFGADEPGGIKNLVSWVPIKVGVVTAIGDIPVHIEFFGSRNELVKEKASLVESLSADGQAILNYDYQDVRQMNRLSKAPVSFYGLSQPADIYLSEIKFSSSVSEPVAHFKLNYNGNTVPVRMNNILGKHQLYSAVVAVSVGTYFGMNLVEMAQALQDFQPPPGRMRPIKGIKGTLIIDDSYNASPTPVLSALDTMARYENCRKIAILGDMTELGEYTEKAHKQIGERVAEVADTLFAVGDCSKFTADSAKKAGMKEEKIREFETSDEARLAVQDYIKKGDLILIKGSQSMRMEKIVEEIMAEPEKANQFLVRHDFLWKNK